MKKLEKILKASAKNRIYRGEEEEEESRKQSESDSPENRKSKTPESDT